MKSSTYMPGLVHADVTVTFKGNTCAYKWQDRMYEADYRCSPACRDTQWADMDSCQSKNGDFSRYVERGFVTWQCFSICSVYLHFFCLKYATLWYSIYSTLYSVVRDKTVRCQANMGSAATLILIANPFYYWNFHSYKPVGSGLEQPKLKKIWAEVFFNRRLDCWYQLMVSAVRSWLGLQQHGEYM